MRVLLYKIFTNPKSKIPVGLIMATSGLIIFMRVLGVSWYVLGLFGIGLVGVALVMGGVGSVVFGFLD